MSVCMRNIHIVLLYAVTQGAVSQACLKTGVCFRGTNCGECATDPRMRECSLGSTVRRQPWFYLVTVLSASGRGIDESLFGAWTGSDTRCSCFKKKRMLV